MIGAVLFWASDAYVVPFTFFISIFVSFIVLAPFLVVVFFPRCSLPPCHNLGNQQIHTSPCPLGKADQDIGVG